MSRLTGRRAEALGRRVRLPDLRQGQLPRLDHRADRPRGRHHRADPLPPFRVEARALPRLPRRRSGRRCGRSGRTRSSASGPGQLAQVDRQGLPEAARPRASSGRPLDPGTDGGRGRPRDPPRAAPPDPRGARVRRRGDPARARRRAGSIADRDPDAEAWIFISLGLLSTIDHRLGNLVGGEFEDIVASRRVWMTGSDI